jgi:DNA-binding transcriptional ArsR family regulator
MGVRRKRSRQESLVAALRHPIRRRILREMSGGPPDSPRQLARKLREPLSNVSYHFRVLAECEVLELVRTRPVRGATEHFYRVAIADEEMLAALEGGAAPDTPRGEEND